MSLINGISIKLKVQGKIWQLRLQNFKTKVKYLCIVDSAGKVKVAFFLHTDFSLKTHTQW